MASEQRSRALRLFSCPACSHRLRFGAVACGKCYEPTPVYNRLISWLAVLLVFTVAAGALFLQAIGQS